MTRPLGILEKKYTFEEYLQQEAHAEHKNEYHDGKIIPMPNAKYNHNKLGAKIGALLISHLDQTERPCDVLASEMKVYISAVNRSLYPDTTVVCGKPEFYEGKRYVITNPLLVVEVLSDSTESYDRGDKFLFYCKLPSFREYVLVNQYKPQVEVKYLIDPKENLWKHSVADSLEQSVYLHSIDCNLALQDVYRNIKFEERDSRQDEEGIE